MAYLGNLPFELNGGGFVVDMSNAWPNYYVGILWLIVFIVFIFLRYPGHGRRD